MNMLTGRGGIVEGDTERTVGRLIRSHRERRDRTRGGEKRKEEGD